VNQKPIKQNNYCQRTKRCFKDVFIKLIKIKGYTHVTIKDIAEHACYNRSTFYHYYSCKDEMAEEIVQEMIKGFIDSSREGYIKGKFINLAKFPLKVVHVFDYIYSNSKYYDLLILDDTLPLLRSRLIDSMKHLTREMKLMNNKNMPYDWSELHICYHVFGVLGIIIEWVKNRYSTPPEQLTKELIEVICNFNPNMVIGFDIIGDT